MTENTPTAEQVWCEVGEHYVDSGEMWPHFGDCMNCCSEKNYLTYMSDEESDEEELKVYEFDYCGMTFLREQNGVSMFDMRTHDHIGEWNDETQYMELVFSATWSRRSFRKYMSATAAVGPD